MRQSAVRPLSSLFPGRIRHKQQGVGDAMSVETERTQPYRPERIERGGQIYSSTRRPVVRKPAPKTPAQPQSKSEEHGKQSDE